MQKITFDTPEDFYSFVERMAGTGIAYKAENLSGYWVVIVTGG